MILLWTQQSGNDAVDERRTVLDAVTWADKLIGDGVVDANTVQVETLTGRGKSRIRSLQAARWEAVGSEDWGDLEGDARPSTPTSAVIEIQSPGGEWVTLRMYDDVASAETEASRKYKMYLLDRVRVSPAPVGSGGRSSAR